MTFNDNTYIEAKTCKLEYIFFTQFGLANEINDCLR